MKLFKAIIFIALFTNTVQGIVFFSPDSVTATNTSAFAPSSLIDISGLSSTPVTLANIGSILHSDGVGADVWRGSSTALPITLTFDFNSSQQIDYIGLWQGLSIREGVRDFNLSFWDGAIGGGNQIGGVYSDILDTGAGGTNSILLIGRSFDVGTRIGVNSITMEITSIAVPGNPFVHMGEFMVATVPEPSDYVLVFTGLVGLVVIKRKRKNGNK